MGGGPRVGRGGDGWVGEGLVRDGGMVDSPDRFVYRILDIKKHSGCINPIFLTHFHHFSGWGLGKSETPSFAVGIVTLHSTENSHHKKAQNNVSPSMFLPN